MEKTQDKLLFLLADDHSIIRQGLEIIIKELFLNATVNHANNLTETFSLVSNLNVDVLILDISFPEGNSLSIISEIIKIKPKTKVLIFTAYDEEFYALRYIKAGASGYLNKLSSEEEIKLAINNIIIKGKHISQSIQDKILESFISKKPLNPLEGLSDREMEVAILLVKGYGNLEISYMLNIKQNTISTLKNRIFQKLEINNLPSLIELFNLYGDSE
ncbi:hypothetical protein SY27_03350 [Flavobacterium sp. 316]|uniref:response regulator transcription factor n=1 Tax=Flavobacterium sp. 316 TaxID=1603293 RepID=UPI0005DC785E|nr:response regulator transcription factor [Flavobacterium sp. 316]KIX22863.1 hypothetical protein SY27_03350 [Flavobacterium sp. 316]